MQLRCFMPLPVLPCARFAGFARVRRKVLTASHFEKRELRMSDPVIKGVKRPTPRPATRSASSASKAKSRKLHAKAARTKAPAKRASAAKPPVRKAAKKSGAAPKAAKKGTK